MEHSLVTAKFLDHSLKKKSFHLSNQITHCHQILLSYNIWRLAEKFLVWPTSINMTQMINCQIGGRRSFLVRLRPFQQPIVSDIFMFMKNISNTTLFTSSRVTCIIILYILKFCQNISSKIHLFFIFQITKFVMFLQI